MDWVLEILCLKFGTEYFLGNAGRLPQLVPDQTLKLKQLTVLTLAETDKKKGPFSENLDVMNNIFSEGTTPKHDIP
ncbi:hypothetical protein CsSME_00036701 [Camellia sinensis var. sinensis]